MHPLGHNISLTREDIERAVRERIIEILRAKGANFDPTSVRYRSRIHWLRNASEGGGKTVETTFDDAMITWED